MSRVIYWFDRISNFFTLLVVSIILLISAVLLTFAPSAHAKSLTPEADSYQVDHGAGEVNGYYHLQSTQEPLAAEKAKQPIHPGTNRFINDVQERAGNVVENTKNAFGGVVEDAKDTIQDSFDRP